MRKGQRHSSETKKKLRIASILRDARPPDQTGKKFPIRKLPKNRGQKRFPQPEKTKEKIRNSLKGKYGGEKHYLWKGGASSLNNKIRTSAEYRIWRKAVFERDNFTCQKYGTRGGDLEAHHINNFVDFIEIRLAIDNGITLSKKAHYEFHKKYGKISNTLEQLIEFLNIK